MTAPVAPRETRLGPWLVALGAALWGTESAWRIPLADVFDVDVLVFWEHVLLVLLALPFVLPRLGELRRVRGRTVAWLLFSGIAGSAAGAVLFTLAIEHSNGGNATVINVVLNIQPVLSTTVAALLLGDRLSRWFFPWAALAVGAGVGLVLLAPNRDLSSHAAIGYALGCALLWGLSTVAGRAVMVEMSLPLAAGLRVVIGLVAMTALLLARGMLAPAALWPAAVAGQVGHVVTWFLLLATISGAVPLVVYFAGLRRTRASTAGYFEMMQTVAAVAITWGIFAEGLSAAQVGAAVVLIGAVAMVQRAQGATAER